VLRDGAALLGRQLGCARLAPNLPLTPERLSGGFVELHGTQFSINSIPRSKLFSLTCYFVLDG
jgi:hypothetical protein